MSEPLKYCKDCKYYSGSIFNLFTEGNREVCVHPDSDMNADESAIRTAEAKTLVRGGPALPLVPDYTSCWIMRKHNCGIEAKLFEPKKGITIEVGVSSGLDSGK